MAKIIRTKLDGWFNRMVTTSGCNNDSWPSSPDIETNEIGLVNDLSLNRYYNRYMNTNMNFLISLKRQIFNCIYMWFYIHIVKGIKLWFSVPPSN